MRRDLCLWKGHGTKLCPRVKVREKPWREGEEKREMIRWKGK